MASQPNILDHSQLQGLVGWLEEQHRQDRAEITRLASEIERLTTVIREQALQLAEVRANMDRGQSTLERIPLVDESVKQVREQVADLVGRFDEHAQKSTQTFLLRAADAERDRKVLNDLAQTVGRLEHEGAALGARFQVVSDEARRDRSIAAELPKTIETLEGRLASFQHRADQLEEMARRVETVAQQQRQELEAIRNEQSRAAQWRQLTDLRWTRQVSEWQTAIDNWREAADEHARPVQHLLQQVGQARDEVRSTLGQLGDQARRLDDLSAGAGRLDTALAQQRETLARVEQTLDAQRRRFDEQASAQLRLDEAVGRVTDARAASDRAGEERSRQLDELRANLRVTDADLARTRQELTDASAALRDEADGARSLANQALQSLADTIRQVDARFAEMGDLLRAQRQRAVIDLEQQMRELGELVIRNRAD